MSKRTKWLNIVGTLLLVILILIVVGAVGIGASGLFSLGSGGSGSGSSDSGSSAEEGEGGSGSGGEIIDGSSYGSSDGSSEGGFSSFLSGFFSLDGCSSCSGCSSCATSGGIGEGGGSGSGSGSGLDISSWFSSLLESGVDIGSLSLEEGDYSFVAEEGGTFTFTAGEDSDLTITDADGNEYEIKGGESVDIEIEEGDTVDITANTDSELSVSGGGSGSGSGSGSGDGSGSGSGGGSGGGLSNLDVSGLIAGSSSGSASGTAATAFSIYSEASGTVYLKLISYGDYQGSSWAQSTAYSGLLGGSYSMSYLLGLALANGGYDASLVKIENNTDDYILPYQLSTGSCDYDIQTSDVYYTGSSSEYSLYAYYYDYLTDGTSGLSLPSSYSSAERTYRSYVYENYTDVNSSTLAALEAIIEANNLYSTDAYTCISNIVSYVKGSATYNLSYNTALDSEDDIVVAFLTEYNEGVCQHFASAATLLLRACGIPARYTGGYIAETTSGKWSDVTTLSAHAWVEVYINGLGWVVVDPTADASSGGTSGGGTSGGGTSGGGTSGGGAIEQKIALTVYSNSGTKIYDGTAYNCIAHISSGTLSSEHTIQYNYNSYVEVGSYSNVFTVTITDSGGSDVTNSYNITYDYGTLAITKRDITITTGSDSKSYDGTPLTCDTCTTSGLADGHTVSVVYSGSQTSRGESENEVESVTIYDANGNDVTKNYAIKLIYGTLTVS